MWYNDDDEEKGQNNWKNSEVARLFVENYLDPMLVKQAENTDEEVSDVPQEDIKVSVASEDGGLQKVEAQLRDKVDLVINKLAELSSQYGNEKVRYKMERAIMELEDIKLRGE